MHSRKHDLPMNDLQPLQTAEEGATTLTTSLETSVDDDSARNHNHSPPTAFLVNSALILPQVIFGLGSVIAALGLPACNPLFFALVRECSAGIILLGAAGWSLQSSATTSVGLSNNTDIVVPTTVTAENILKELLVPLQQNTVRFLFLGLAIYGNQAGAIVGIKFSGPVAAAVWQPSQPTMTAAICMAMRWEPVNYWRIGGILLAFLGCVLMVALDYEKSVEEQDDATEDGIPIIFLVGNFLFFINCLGTSLYVILSKNVLQIYAPLVVTAWSYSIAAIFMALTTLLASTSTSFMAFLCPECTTQWHIPTGALFALAYFILFNSCAAYAIITWVNNYATGTLVMGYTVLQPVTAALLTLLLLSLGAVSSCEATQQHKDGKDIACLDPPGWGSLCGMVGVFAGLYLMITTEPKSRHEPNYDPVVAQDPT